MGLVVETQSLKKNQQGVDLFVQTQSLKKNHHSVDWPKFAPSLQSKVCNSTFLLSVIFLSKNLVNMSKRPAKNVASCPGKRQKGYHQILASGASSDQIQDEPGRGSDGSDGTGGFPTRELGADGVPSASIKISNRINDDSDDCPPGYVAHKIFVGRMNQPYIIQYWPAVRWRKNVTQEELDSICPGYWCEDSQHDSDCQCHACTILFERDPE